jgi:hypothetical protein
MKTHYTVEALAKMPDFKGERRYIGLERQRAMRERDNLPEKAGLLAGKSLGIFRRADWTDYIHELDRYGAALDKHEEEIAEGLIPFQVLVTNHGNRMDKSVWVHVTVENGEVDQKKKMPVRPERLDAALEGSSPWPKITGFRRYGVAIKPHSLEAVFSQLEGEESEMLLQNILYLDLYSDTRITYTVKSKNVKVLHGEIPL